ncbi:MAG: Gfo/Idh/MocA family oxidoreductase [Clostridiales bacterium]|nr:Gfo/Idh/MocA family oxidoreductase [Clostridiales bacterium]
MNDKNKHELHVAIIGCGDFAKHFVPLFLAHPTVDSLKVCDIDEKRAREYAKTFNVGIIKTFEDVINDKAINTVAIFTQRHTHGDLVVRALNAGKDVYSAVPMAVSVEDCKRIIDAVKQTGRIYMMGETCIYYPSAMYCKEAFERGEFGDFVYAESQYYHDISHFPKEFQDDKPNSAVPPFFYPTHSTAMVLHATNSYVTKVSAMGYCDIQEDTPFAIGKNPWDNTFSNEFSLMRLSNGGVARVNECRRIGYKAPSSSVQSFYGTKGSYQFSNAQHIMQTLTEQGVTLKDVSHYVNPEEMTQNNNGTVDFKNCVANHGYQWYHVSPIQAKEYKRIPDSYRKIAQVNGHMASHQLLIDEFCTCVANGKMPYVNAWRAARFTIPGLIAHESAKQGGKLLDVPDFGGGPEET